MGENTYAWQAGMRSAPTPGSTSAISQTVKYILTCDPAIPSPPLRGMKKCPHKGLGETVGSDIVQNGSNRKAIRMSLLQ